MADTYSDRLGLILMEEGSHSNEWGDLTNLNLNRLDSATRGFLSVALSGSKTLTANDITAVTDTAQEEGFFAFLEFTGTAGVVTVPAENIMWIIRNKCGSGTLTITPSGGTGVTVAQNATAILVYGANGTTMTDVTAEMGIGQHIADTTAAHAASAIANTPSGNLAATDVQTALNELQTDIDSRAPAADPIAMAIALG